MIRSKPSWLLRILGFACLALLALRIVTFGLADYLARSEPDVALVFDEGQSLARVALANRGLTAREPNLDMAIDEAKEALRHHPLAAGALTALARARDQKGDEAAAHELMLRAARTAQRDLRAQIWLLDYEIRKGDIAGATARIDTIFRGQNPSIWGTLLNALTPVVMHEKFRMQFAELLATRPPWRSIVLRNIAQQTKEVSGLLALYQALQASAAPPTQDETRDYLNRLIREKLWDQAYVAWLQSLPPERLSSLGLLYNADFQYPLGGLPFDWVINRAPGALINVVREDKGRALQADFFGGRVAINHVSHLLALPPGSYRLKGEEQAQALRNERGLRWRIFCLDDPTSSLTVSRPLKGDVPPQAIAVTFEVPDRNCQFQSLVLELPATVALETEIAGRASYRNLNIESVTPR